MLSENAAKSWLVCFPFSLSAIAHRYFSARYGQLSGMVEPIAGIFGAFAVVVRNAFLVDFTHL